MKIVYHKELEIETCIVLVLKKKIRMRALEKIIKEDNKGRSYLRTKIEYEINDSVGYFYTETDIIDFLRNKKDLGEEGFVYALYCLIGKAFHYSDLNDQNNPDIDLLKKSLEKNKILDGNAGINIDQNILAVCIHAYNFLINTCKLTDSDLAFMPEILLGYLNNELKYYI